MLNVNHRFALVLLSKQGSLLGQFPLDPNWEPACECALFSAQREGRLREGGANCATSIEPVPDATAGAPYASGFRATVRANGQGSKACDFPITYFSRQAKAASAALVKKQLLKAGEEFFYRLAAFPQSPSSGESIPPRFEIVEETHPLPVRESPRTDLDGGTVPIDEQDSGDIPVIIPEEVMEETTLLTEKAGARETGGILIGHLQCACRRGVPDLALVVTAQIPARLAEGEVDKLTFTAATWAAVESAVALRRSREVMLGWWHSHPAKYWPQLSQHQDSPERLSFFSAADVHLHETVFSKAFHVALVLTLVEKGALPALYGWRLGMVQRRGFSLLRNPPTRLEDNNNTANANAHDSGST